MSTKHHWPKAVESKDWRKLPDLEYDELENDEDHPTPDYVKELLGFDPDEEITDNSDFTDNVFCPTGKGGGKDPTCSPGKGGMGGQKPIRVDEFKWKGGTKSELSDIYKLAAEQTKYTKMAKSLRQQGQEESAKSIDKIVERTKGELDSIRQTIRDRYAKEHGRAAEKALTMKKAIEKTKAAKGESTPKKKSATKKADEGKPLSLDEYKMELSKYQTEKRKYKEGIAKIRKMPRGQEGWDERKAWDAQSDVNQKHNKAWQDSEKKMKRGIRKEDFEILTTKDIEEISVDEDGLRSYHGMKDWKPTKVFYAEGTKMIYEKDLELEVAETLSNAKNVHPTLWAENKGIVHTKQRNMHDEYWGKEYGMQNFESAATGGDGYIVSYNARSLRTSTIAHESGHNLSKSAFDTTNTPNKPRGIAPGKKRPETFSFEDRKFAHTNKPDTPFNRKRVQNALTEYGKNSPAEDFAEFVAAYNQIVHVGAAEYRGANVQKLRMRPKSLKSVQRLLGDSDSKYKKALQESYDRDDFGSGWKTPKT